MHSELRWKRISFLLGFAALGSTVSSGYWYRESKNPCPWCAKWQPGLLEQHPEAEQSRNGTNPPPIALRSAAGMPSSLQHSPSIESDNVPVNSIPDAAGF